MSRYMLRQVEVLENQESPQDLPWPGVIQREEFEDEEGRLGLRLWYLEELDE